MSENRHPTTRRGVIAALGFGGVSLYGLWVAYGAAPGPLALLSRAEPGAGDSSGSGSGGHGGHGAAPDGSTTENFRRSAAEFIERYRMADGSVYPRRLAAGSMPAMKHDGHTMPMAGDGDAAATGSHGMQHAMPAALSAPAHGDGHDGAETAPIDVYLLAEKWFYEPSDLRLDVGVPYRFRMLAADVSHGASIQFGRGARMIRLRPDTVAEMDVSFTRPGRYLVYCTVYCGQAHDQMQARIDVV
jgi:cytochrome c oxidase subunit II